MITSEKVKKNQVESFKRACLLYRRIYNLYFEYEKTITSRRTMSNRILKNIKIDIDKRIAYAIPFHIKEHKEYLNAYSDFYVLRLGDVHLIDGQFIWNELCFTFPELVNKHFTVKTIKLYLCNNKICAQLLDEDLEERIRFVTPHYTHKSNYIDEHSYITDPALFKLVLGTL